jgi:hypothetical protein
MAILRPLPPILRAARILALAGLAAIVALACGDDPNRNDASAMAGLVVQSGDPAASLTTFDVRGTARPLALPKAPVRWISAGRRGTLIATTRDGGLQLSDRVLPDKQIAWHAVPGPDVEMVEEPLGFGTWSANGLRVAAVATDFADNQSLVIVDPVGDSSLILPLGGPVLPEPPAWIDEQRVGVPAPQGLELVDTSTGDSTRGPPGVRLFTVSADGQAVAVEAPGGGEIELRTTAEWLAGRGSPAARISAEGDPGALALDRLGRRLAIAWERDGDPGLVVVYGRDAGWREIGRIELPGRAAEGVVSWLP